MAAAVALAYCACVLLVPHAHVDHTGAVALLKRWTPKLGAGNVLSVAGIEAFAKARIALQSSEASAIVAADMHLYVVSSTLNPRAVRIDVVLWGTGDCDDDTQVQALRDLRHWAAHRKLGFVVAPALAEQWHRAGMDL